jgi:hypothetical protein
LVRNAQADAVAPLVPDPYRRHGFLPVDDPLSGFPADSPCHLLDDIGRELPALLGEHGFRKRMRKLALPSRDAAVVDVALCRIVAALTAQSAVPRACRQTAQCNRSRSRRRTRRLPGRPAGREIPDKGQGNDCG